MDVGGEGVAAVISAGRPVAVAVAPEVDGDGAEPFGGQTTGGAVPGVARQAGAVRQDHDRPIWVASAVDGEFDAVGAFECDRGRFVGHEAGPSVCTLSKRKPMSSGSSRMFQSGAMSLA